MERQHSLLNPSSAEIWINCTRAPRFAEKFVKAQSDYADEGTLCHDIATDLLNFRLGRISKKNYNARLAFHRSNELYDKEMDGYAEAFVTYCLGFYDAAKLKGWAMIWVEERIDYGHIAPSGFGYLDVAILSKGTIDIIDFKYGKGIPVSAIRNKQLSIYAIGVLSRAQFIDDFSIANLHIFQPRIDNISTFVCTVIDLTEWAHTVVKQAGTLAFDGKGEFKAGAHCRFCAARPKCKAATDYHMQLAKYDFVLPYEMDNDDIAEVLLIGETLVNWYTAVREYATQEARKGVEFPGHKLVPGKSVRKFIEHEKENIVKTLIKNGYAKEDFLKTSLAGIGEMEKLLGKVKMVKLLSKFITKPTGAPTLVAESDKRKAISGTEGAKNDFKDIKF
jgi:hypothetical protein